MQIGKAKTLQSRGDRRLLTPAEDSTPTDKPRPSQATPVLLSSFLLNKLSRPLTCSPPPFDSSIGSLESRCNIRRIDDTC